MDKIIKKDENDKTPVSVSLNDKRVIHTTQGAINALTQNYSEKELEVFKNRRNK